MGRTGNEAIVHCHVLQKWCIHGDCSNKYVYMYEASSFDEDFDKHFGVGIEELSLLAN